MKVKQKEKMNLQQHKNQQQHLRCLVNYDTILFILL